MCVASHSGREVRPSSAPAKDFGDATGEDKLVHAVYFPLLPPVRDRAISRPV
jgi:hypothetical protein